MEAVEIFTTTFLLSIIHLSSVISALLKNKKKNIKKIDASHLKYKNALHNKR